MGSSAPPSIHYGTVNGQVVRDIHDDGDFPDGTLYLALIYMGRYGETPKVSFSVSNCQISILFTLSAFSSAYARKLSLKG